MRQGDALEVAPHGSPWFVKGDTLAPSPVPGPRRGDGEWPAGLVVSRWRKGSGLLNVPICAGGEETGGSVHAFLEGLRAWPGAGHPQSCSDLLSWSLLLLP